MNQVNNMKITVLFNSILFAGLSKKESKMVLIEMKRYLLSLNVRRIQILFVKKKAIENNISLRLENAYKLLIDIYV